MGAYERIMNLCNRRNVTPKAVEMACGLSNGSIGKLRKGSMTAERMQLIAEYFDVTVEYLLTGKTKDYYTDPETAKVAQEIFDNPDLRLLFDVSKDASPEDLKLAAEMVRRMKATNPDG